jgi:hypothetical protein
MPSHPLVRITVTCLLISGPLAPVAHGLDSAGVRAGLRFDPDQIVLGAQGGLFDLTPDVRVRGTTTLGFGDDITIFGVTAEVHYVARSAPLGEGAYFYVGGGPDLANSWFDVGDDTRGDTDLGLALLGGVEREIALPGRLFGEFRLHVHDSDEWFELQLGLDFSLAP